MNTTNLSLSGLDDDRLLDPSQTGEALEVKESTLAVWRSTGRYALPYIKVGRLVRYKVGDIREFIARRTRVHTGEGV